MISVSKSDAAWLISPLAKSAITCALLWAAAGCDAGGQHVRHFLLAQALLQIGHRLPSLPPLPLVPGVLVAAHMLQPRAAGSRPGRPRPEAQPTWLMSLMTSRLSRLARYHDACANRKSPTSTATRVPYSELTVSLPGVARQVRGSGRSDGEGQRWCCDDARGPQRAEETSLQGKVAGKPRARTSPRAAVVKHVVVHQAGGVDHLNNLS